MKKKEMWLLLFPDSMTLHTEDLKESLDKFLDLIN
jgi:hypothetical protein